METILVTGATGFIGSHLVPLLRSRYDVYTLERYVTGRYSLDPEYTYYADLNDHVSIRKIIGKLKPNRVIHLAAISAVAYSYNHSNEVMNTNYRATMNLAEACLELLDFKQFIFAGTSEEYGQQGSFPIKEDAPLRANSPYSASKIAADRYLQYLYEAYDLPFTVVRPFNTYGRMRNRHFIVERIITQMLSGGEVTLGDPHPRRDFMYIVDHLNAYLACIGNDKAVGEAFNFCTGVEVTIKTLADNLKDLTGWKGEVQWNKTQSRPYDIYRLLGDNGKAKRILGWMPQYSLEDGLTETIRRYRESHTVEQSSSTI